VLPDAGDDYRQFLGCTLTGQLSKPCCRARSGLLSFLHQELEEPMLELYHDWRSFLFDQVRLCLAEKGLPGGAVNRSHEARTPNAGILALDPNGVVPTLVHDGVADPWSTPHQRISRRVFPDIPLMPKDPVDRARARFWVKI